MEIKRIIAVEILVKFVTHDRLFTHGEMIPFTKLRTIIFSKYHTVRNMLFMALTEFKKLGETSDWGFMRAKQGQIAFLFGVDDHWGPLTMFEEISKQATDIALSIEEEGHTLSRVVSCTCSMVLKIKEGVEDYH